MKSEKEKLMKVIEGVKSISTSLQLIIIVPLRFKPEIENLKKVANDCGCDIDVIGIPEKSNDDDKTIYVVPISNDAPKIIYEIK